MVCNPFPVYNPFKSFTGISLSIRNMCTFILGTRAFTIVGLLFILDERPPGPHVSLNLLDYDFRISWQAHITQKVGGQNYEKRPSFRIITSFREVSCRKKKRK